MRSYQSTITALLLGALLFTGVQPVSAEPRELNTGQISAAVPTHYVAPIHQFCRDFERRTGVSLQTDYLAMMRQACLTGNVEAGHEAERLRNEKLQYLGLSDSAISFDDLFELSKIITHEIGADWHPIEWKMMVGEVVLNRVASPEYPDTIHDVIYQPWQYQSVDTRYYETLLPLEDCVEAAARLLSGERLINDISVVAQSGTERGSGTFTQLYDEKTGVTVYLCYTNYPELYEM